MNVLSRNISNRGRVLEQGLLWGLLELGYSGHVLALPKDDWEGCQTLAERGAVLFVHDSRKR